MRNRILKERIEQFVNEMVLKWDKKKDALICDGLNDDKKDGYHCDGLNDDYYRDGSNDDNKDGYHCDGSNKDGDLHTHLPPTHLHNLHTSLPPTHLHNLHTNHNTISLFTDTLSDSQYSLLIIATYKEILSLLIRNIQNKNWSFVYAYTYLLYKLKSEIRISINVDKLEFIKMSLRGRNEKSYALINKMLEMKKFVIVEEYKEFEIEVEYNRIMGDH